MRQVIWKWHFSSLGNSRRQTFCFNQIAKMVWGKCKICINKRFLSVLPSVCLTFAGIIHPQIKLQASTSSTRLRIIVEVPKMKGIGASSPLESQEHGGQLFAMKQWLPLAGIPHPKLKLVASKSASGFSWMTGVAEAKKKTIGPSWPWSFPDMPPPPICTLTSN